MRALFVVLLLLAAATPAAALPEPEDGFWWNPAESGRGWNIETQNGLMLVTSFTFTPSGQPIFYTSAGTYNATTGVWTANLVTSENGQCFGCSYRSPVSGNAGPVSITFTNFFTGTINFPGGSTPIRRFYANYSAPNEFLFGGWAATRNVSTLIDGEWINLDGTTTASNGVYVTGRRDGTNNVAVARYEPGINRYIMLLDSTTANWKYWEFVMGKDFMIGVGWLYPKGGAPTGPGNVFYGGRIASRAELAGTSDDKALRTALESIMLQYDSGKSAGSPKGAQFVKELEAVIENYTAE